MRQNDRKVSAKTHPKLLSWAS